MTQKNKLMKTVTLVDIGMAGISQWSPLSRKGRWTRPRRLTNGLKTEAVVDSTANLHVPDDYRATYQFLGSWAVAAG